MSLVAVNRPGNPGGCWVRVRLQWLRRTCERSISAFDLNGRCSCLLRDGGVRQRRNGLGLRRLSDSGRAELTPRGESSGAVRLEDIPPVEVVILVEMVEN